MMPPARRGGAAAEPARRGAEGKRAAGKGDGANPKDRGLSMGPRRALQRNRNSQPAALIGP
eukprot:15415102-Alexandrium_andersonii.AAC.1